MTASSSWEKGFQSAVRAGRRGWGIYEARGKMQLKISLPYYKEFQVLPIDWNPRSQAEELQLIGRLYKALHPA